MARQVLTKRELQETSSIIEEVSNELGNGVASKIATIINNKETIKTLKANNLQLFRECLSSIVAEAKNVKLMAMFKESPRSVVSKIVKANLSLDKDVGLTSLSLRYYESGISLNLNDEDVSPSFVLRVLKSVDKGLISKSLINRSSIEEIKGLLKSLNDEQ